MNVYIWTSGSLKNAYIGEYKGWKPWANTVAYYPLTDDFNDHKWTWTAYNLTNSWWSITTYGWVKCAYYSWSTSVYSQNTSISFWTTRTIVFWGYLLNTGTAPVVWTWIYSYNSLSTRVVWYGGSKSSISNYQNYWLNGTSNVYWKWVNIVWISDWSKMELYVNWQLEASWSNTLYAWSQLKIWWRLWGSWSEHFTWYVNEIILEDKARTAQEVQDYYNQTKSNYWL